MIRLLTVGKLKNKHYKELCAMYLERCQTLRKVELLEIKDEPLGRPNQQALEKEAQRITQATKGTLFLLDEHGATYHSQGFSQLLDTHRPITLAIGGPLGFSQQLRSDHPCIRLSDLTFAHALARLVLVEQVYRGLTICVGHPYHNS